MAKTPAEADHAMWFHLIALPRSAPQVAQSPMGRLAKSTRAV